MSIAASKFSPEKDNFLKENRFHLKTMLFPQLLDKVDIRWFEDGQCELYHLQDDLGERHNLAAEQPQQVEVLVEELDAWLASVDAKLPQPRAEAETSP